MQKCRSFLTFPFWVSTASRGERGNRWLVDRSASPQPLSMKSLQLGANINHQRHRGKTMIVGFFLAASAFARPAQGDHNHHHHNRVVVWFAMFAMLSDPKRGRNRRKPQLNQLARKGGSRSLLVIQYPMVLVRFNAVVGSEKGFSRSGPRACLNLSTVDETRFEFAGREVDHFMPLSIFV